MDTDFKVAFLHGAQRKRIVEVSRIERIDGQRKYFAEVAATREILRLNFRRCFFCFIVYFLWEFARQTVLGEYADMVGYRVSCRTEHPNNAAGRHWGGGVPAMKFGQNLFSIVGCGGISHHLEWNVQARAFRN